MTGACAARRHQVLLLTDLVLRGIQGLGFRFHTEAPHQMKELVFRSARCDLIDPQASLDGIAREEDASRNMLADLAWAGKAEALRWALHERNAKYTLQGAGDGVAWVEDFMNHPARKPSGPCDSQQSPDVLDPQWEGYDLELLSSDKHTETDGQYNAATA